jgi:hypothetical protein
MDLAGMAGDVIGHAAGIPGPIAAVLNRLPNNMTKAAMADFLQSPERFIAGVSKKLSAGRPLTQSEEAILRIARTASVAAPELAGSQ